MASVRFITPHKRYRVYTGLADPSFIEFVDGAYETEVPEVIGFLVEKTKSDPSSVQIDPENGTFLCPVCFAGCKNKLGLRGHMNKHPEYVWPTEEADDAVSE